VPDIDRIIKIYHKNFVRFEAKANSPWVGLICDGQSIPYDFHKTGFNALSISLNCVVMSIVKSIHMSRTLFLGLKKGLGNTEQFIFA